MQQEENANATSVQRRKVQAVDINDALCVQATSALFNINTAGGIAGAFGEDNILSCLSGDSTICDYRQLRYTSIVSIRCSLAGGFIITGNVNVCREDLDGNRGLILTNVPVCLAPSCSADITYRDLLRTLYDIAAFDGELELIEYVNTFSGFCDVSNPTPAPINDRAPTPAPTLLSAADFKNGIDSGECKFLFH